ncbi:FRG domain-containing protein [Verminephrobacter aporrectodeae subsp. tuberculatae]|uniref:FRG domain-containing protein n=1 Tax=Verminephrobacter aporrectodeae TaxID=1110389 RepID=UPI002243DC4A|nr:FRG domain-containing protein [Verminephrobacter aporrectodeae]MCW8163507.1 FRG domain-containing protein [Verminephrobacter aporrectodeae subsp. tuberculatae]MCW8167772.1 FRG domain-containing protein [Verminephrobacter aporrectodeae subsp. tuberculatae]
MSETNLSISEMQTSQVSPYFKKIPLWQSTVTKRFEIMADASSGRIPVTRLESWQDFTVLLEHEFFNRPGVELVFRGHRRFDWDLTPTLGRISGTKGMVSGELAFAQLNRFKRAVRGRLENATLVNAEDEMWAIGQHYGLMTPLLDWTYSPYVALFFAFYKEDSQDESDNPYRVVYVLNKSFLGEHQEETGIRLVEPLTDYHGRLVNQAGLFTFSPYESTIENKLADALANGEGFDDKDLRNASEEEQPDILARYICKIYISNEKRDTCLPHLRRMNVHHASLFPDLLGASEYCNIMTEEAEREIQFRHAPQAAEATPDSIAVRPTERAVELVAKAGTAAGSIKTILRAPPGAEQVEPGRIELMAQELAQSLEKNKVVDWNKRETAQAHSRNVARVLLRKYGYPPTLRDAVAEQIVEMIKQPEDPLA